MAPGGCLHYYIMRRKHDKLCLRSSVCVWVCVYDLKCNVRAFRLSEPCSSSCVTQINFHFLFCICTHAVCVCVFTYVMCGSFSWLHARAYQSYRRTRGGNRITGSPGRSEWKYFISIPCFV